MGDIGGSGSLNGVRSLVRILRAPEPTVNLEWATNPVSVDLGQVETFTFSYPDGSYDAETVWYDAVSNAVFVVTKESAHARAFF